MLLSRGGKLNLEGDEYYVLDIAVSDYLTASYLNDPKIGSVAAAWTAWTKPA